MTYHSNLSQLRFGLSRLYVREAREHRTTTPGLHHLLPIPIRERLILLAVIDGADERAIRRSLKVSREDATLTSRRMKRTLQRITTYLREPHQQLPEVWTRADLTPDKDLTNGVWFEDSNGVAWNRRYGNALEAHLGRLLWSDVAVSLIGHSVPRSIVRLSLTERLSLYLLLVEQCKYREVLQYVNTTEFKLDNAVLKAMRICAN